MISWFKRRPAHLSDEDISAYLDGELDFRASQRLLAHLRDCDECDGRVEDLRVVRSLFRSLPAAAAPRSFALTPAQAGTQAHVSRPANRSVRPVVFTYAPAVALALLVAVIGVDLAVVSDEASFSARTSSEPENITLSRDNTAQADALKSEAAAAPAAPVAPAASPPTAPQPAAAPGASRPADADAPSVAPTPSVQPFNATPPAGPAGGPIPPPATGRIEPVQPTASAEAFSGAVAAPGSDAAVEDKGGPDDVTAIRVLEGVLALIFLITVIAFLRPRLFSKGDS